MDALDAADELAKAAPSPQTAARESDIPVPNVSTSAPSGAIPPLASELTIEPTYTGRKGRKRKTQAEQEPAAPAPVVVVTPEQVQAVGKAIGAGFDVIFQLVASKRGKHWLLEPEQRDTLGHAWAEALAPWLGASAKYVPLAIAALVTAGVVMPRIQKDAEDAAALGDGKTLPDGRSLEVVQ